MLHKYGTEPIKLSTNDVRRRELMHVGTTNKHLERKQCSLNTTIALDVNRHERDHVNRRGAEIGFYWYAQDKLRIFEFVYARVTAGLPALHAIYDYYDLNGIEEDDFAIDTAERLWKRWRAENKKEVYVSTPQFVPRLRTLLLSQRQAKDAHVRLLRFLDADVIRYDPRYRNMAEAFIFGYYTSDTFQVIADRTGRAQDSVARSGRKFREYIEYNSDLRKVVAYCLSTVEARATPSVMAS